MANYSVNSTIETVVSGLTGNNNVTLTGVSYSTVEGGAGNDIIRGSSGSNFNRYEGGAGNDVFYVYNDSLKGAPNTIHGGVGNTINGGAGNDTIYVGPVSSTQEATVLLSSIPTTTVMTLLLTVKTLSPKATEAVKDMPSTPSS